MTQVIPYLTFCIVRYGESVMARPKGRKYTHRTSINWNWAHLALVRTVAERRDVSESSAVRYLVRLGHACLALTGSGKILYERDDRGTFVPVDLEKVSAELTKLPGQKKKAPRR